jgi:2-polyprenyl-6-methoxyphenol hydroxylase-like FAD-dependent oxidoreductase
LLLFLGMPNFDVDVLIVGGGPTGLMLALEFALHNTSFRIIEYVTVCLV